MATRSKIIECMGHNSPICKCVKPREWREKGSSDFYVSRSPFAYFPQDIQTRGAKNIGLIPYCKECVQKIFEYYYDGGKNPFDASVYYTCQKLDIPFIMEIFNGIFDEYKDGDKADFSNISKKYMGKYIGALNRASVKYADRTDFSRSDTDLSKVDKKIEQRELDKKELEKFQVSWGIQDSFEDYSFLQNKYQQYTKGVEFANAFHPDLYRDLCRDRLILRKISENRYSGSEDITQVQKRIDGLSKKLRIDEFKSNKPKTASELCLFEKIKLVDENNVNEFYKNPTIKIDLNQFRKYEKELVLRPTLNTLVNHRDYDIDLEDLEQYDIK